VSHWAFWGFVATLQLEGIGEGQGLITAFEILPAMAALSISGGTYSSAIDMTIMQGTCTESVSKELMRNTQPRGNPGLKICSLIQG
jgi:hypothetical protein